MNKDGTFNNNVENKFKGIGIHKSRELILTELKNRGLLDKIESYKTTVPMGERSGEIIEPLLTDQWFMKMEDLAKPAIDAVKNSNIKFVPKNFLPENDNGEIVVSLELEADANINYTNRIANQFNYNIFLMKIKIYILMVLLPMLFYYYLI